jgi:hypothetical protein
LVSDLQPGYAVAQIAAGDAGGGAVRVFDLLRGGVLLRHPHDEVKVGFPGQTPSAAENAPGREVRMKGVDGGATDA